MESMITLLTPAFVPFFLIIWIICKFSFSLTIACGTNAFSTSKRLCRLLPNRVAARRLQVRLRDSLLQCFQDSAHDPFQHAKSDRVELRRTIRLDLRIDYNDDDLPVHLPSPNAETTCGTERE